MRELFIAKSRAEYRLYQLQADWRCITDEAARMALARTIAEHPEWGIVCDERDGPQFANIPSAPQPTTEKRGG